MLTVRLSTLQIARRVSHGREELADESFHWTVTSACGRLASLRVLPSHHSSVDFFLSIC